MTSDEQIRVFVLMPFSADFQDIYKLGIKAAAKECNLDAQRVDEQFFSEGMLDRILQQIGVADIIIADMTAQNANVFYEVGYAHALKKLCILVTQKTSDIPFDLKHKKHIVYGGSITNLKEELIPHILWAKSQVINTRKSRIQVLLKSVDADLEKGERTAYATVRFCFDLKNESEFPSAGIESVYFYTGNPWTVTQNSTECSSTASDIEDFKHRYFLTAPVRTLQKNSWAQINFQTKRLMAAVWRGDVLHDKYEITGRVRLRIVTTEGNLDYDFSVDVSADNLPF